VGSPAFAVDPVCSQLKTAVQVLRTAPFHLYITETQNITNPNMAKAASQIGMGGTKQSEEISTGKAIYVLSDGKWIDMQTSFASMEQDKDTDPDAQKTLAETKCKALPDEAMYGQQASVYLESTSDIQSKLWISKATKLPLRTDITSGGGAMTILTVSRYEYGDVRAPEHSMTMQEMVKSAGSRR
jgi:hypothetical protein